MLPALGIPHVSASQPSGHVVYLPPELNGAAPAPGPAPTIPPGTAPITSSPSLAGPHGWTASWQGNRVTFRSAFALSPNTTFAATLGNRDVATSLARQTAGLPFSWSFTTGRVVLPARPITFARKDQSAGAEDLALMNPDGSDVPPTTSHSFSGQRTGPTGAVAVAVQAPTRDPRCGQPRPGSGPFTITARRGGPSPSLNDSADIDLINTDGTGLTPITAKGVSSQPALR